MLPRLDLCWLDSDILDFLDRVDLLLSYVSDFSDIDFIDLPLLLSDLSVVIPFLLESSDSSWSDFSLLGDGFLGVGSLSERDSLSLSDNLDFFFSDNEL